jgi:hypothetical protein
LISENIYLKFCPLKIACICKEKTKTNAKTYRIIFEADANIIINIGIKEKNVNTSKISAKKLEFILKKPIFFIPGLFLTFFLRLLFIIKKSIYEANKVTQNDIPRIKKGSLFPSMLAFPAFGINKNTDESSSIQEIIA